MNMKKNWYSKKALLLLQEIENSHLELPIDLGDLVQRPVVRKIMREPGEVITEDTIDRRIRETVKELRGKGRGKKALVQVERVLAIPPSIRIRNLTPFGKNILRAVQSTDWWNNGLNPSSEHKNHTRTTITLYRDNIVEFLSQLVENNQLEPSVREKAEKIAKTFFQETPSATNVVLVQTRCPVCNSESFAIQTYDEEKMTVLPEVYEMNVSTLLKKALQLIFTNFRLIVPIILVCIFEIFTRVYYYDTRKSYYLAAINAGEKFSIFPNANILYAFNPLLLLIDLLYWLFTLLAIVWILVCLKEREDNPDCSIEVQQSLKKLFHFFPRVFVVFFLITLFSFLLKMISVVLDLFEGSITLTGYDPIINAVFNQIYDGLRLLVQLQISIGLYIGFFLLFYSGAAVVFDDAGIREGIKKSAVFTNEHKSTTIGVLIGSMFISIALTFPIVFISILMETYIGFNPNIITLKASSLTISLNWVNTVNTAVISSFLGIYLIVAYGWAYGRFANRKAK